MNLMQSARWRRLKALFDSVMDLTRGRRRAYLAALTDSAVAANLRRLLSHQDKLDRFLEEPAWGRECAKEPRAARVFAPGDVLGGRLEIGELLGIGGMGEVYRAFDLHTNRHVALKTLRAEIASQPQLVSRLRKEAQLALRITHVNICRLYDFGRAPAPDGRDVVFITMELLEGQTLAEIVRGKPLSTEQAQPVVDQLLAGLEAAHDAGVLHRDFKSGNVIIVPKLSGVDRVVITDFGLARETGRDVRETLTGFGDEAGAGTPAYMAPEQLEGKPLTTAADIYAFGVVLFEIVTGRLPFEGTTPLVIALRRLREDAPKARQFGSGSSRELAERDFVLSRARTSPPAA